MDKFVFGLKPCKVKNRICEVTSTKETTVSELVEIAVSKESDLLKAVDRNSINWVQNQQRSFPFRNGRKTHPYSESRYPNRLRGGLLFNEGNQQSKLTNSQQQFRSKVTRSNQPCKVYGKLHTGNQICKYKDYKCRQYNKVGHLQSVCRNNNVKKNNFSRHFLNNEIDNLSHEPLIFNNNSDNTEPIKLLDVKINNRVVKAQLDTGSGITLMSEKTFLLNFSKYFKLLNDNIKISGYTG